MSNLNERLGSHPIKLMKDVLDREFQEWKQDQERWEMFN
jgi:hypothetical protein